MDSGDVPHSVGRRGVDREWPHRYARRHELAGLQTRPARRRSLCLPRQERPTHDIPHTVFEAQQLHILGVPFLAEHFKVAPFRRGKDLKYIYTEERRGLVVFAIEREINGLAPQGRLRVRQERSRPLIFELEACLCEQRAKLSKNNDQGHQLLPQPLGCLHPLPR